MLEAWNTQGTHTCGKAREAELCVVLVVFVSMVDVVVSKVEFPESHDRVAVLAKTNCKVALFKIGMSRSAHDGLC